MKVLWFTNTPSNYKSGTNAYNGGGWISSLEDELSTVDSVELAISFKLDGQPWRVEQNGTVYYPLSKQLKKSKKVCNLLHGMKYAMEKSDESYLSQMMSVIDNFKPDVIEVFGSEDVFGLIAKITKVPVILHIQGILTPYLNAYLPPFVSWQKYLTQTFKPIGILRKIKERWDWIYCTKREQETLRSVQYYIGRTDWDKRVTKVFNPSCTYFYGSEILRPIFYETAKRTLPEKLTIVTTISSPLYKGFDLVLKTAKLLKDNLHLDFEWHCYGNIDPTCVEKIVHIKHQYVNVKLMGVASAEQLRDAMLSSTCYVHTSYIDNSPNSLCEAQILGLPCIATAVGGVPSLIKNGETGYLVPANDPYQLCYLINKLYSDRELNIKIGEAAKAIAQKRHDKQTIVSNLVETYKKVCQDKDIIE